MIASVAMILCVLAGILIVIVMRGATSLTLSMILKTPEGGYYLGKGGGILKLRRDRHPIIGVNITPLSGRAATQAPQDPGNPPYRQFQFPCA
jgi:hypothetical protein